MHPMKVEPCLKMFTIIIEVNTHQNAYYNLGIGALHVSNNLNKPFIAKPVEEKKFNEFSIEEKGVKKKQRKGMVNRTK